METQRLIRDRVTQLCAWSQLILGTALLIFGLATMYYSASLSFYTNKQMSGYLYSSVIIVVDAMFLLYMVTFTKFPQFNLISYSQMFNFCTLLVTLMSYYFFTADYDDYHNLESCAMYNGGTTSTCGSAYNGFDCVGRESTYSAAVTCASFALNYTATLAQSAQEEFITLGARRCFCSSSTLQNILSVNGTLLPDACLTFTRPAHHAFTCRELLGEGQSWLNQSHDFTFSMAIMLILVFIACYLPFLAVLEPHEMSSYNSTTFLDSAHCRSCSFLCRVRGWCSVVPTMLFCCWRTICTVPATDHRPNRSTMNDTTDDGICAKCWISVHNNPISSCCRRWAAHSLFTFRSVYYEHQIAFTAGSQPTRACLVTDSVEFSHIGAVYPVDPEDVCLAEDWLMAGIRRMEIDRGLVDVSVNLHRPRNSSDNNSNVDANNNSIRNDLNNINPNISTSSGHTISVHTNSPSQQQYVSLVSNDDDDIESGLEVSSSTGAPIAVAATGEDAEVVAEEMKIAYI